MARCLRMITSAVHVFQSMNLSFVVIFGAARAVAAVGLICEVSEVFADCRYRRLLIECTSISAPLEDIKVNNSGTVLHPCSNPG